MQRSQILAADGQPLYLLGSAVDEQMLEEIRRCLTTGEPLPNQPWEAAEAKIQAAWETLTRPENLAALEAWGRGRESFNAWARERTEEAIRVCRSRLKDRGWPVDATNPNGTH
jgi:hypothetical protein